MRRVGISEFRGTCRVNIREYYEKDGEALPGKKVRVKDCLFFVFSSLVCSIIALSARRCCSILQRGI